MKKPAPVVYPVDPLIAERWSPRAFSDQIVSIADICSMMEAARWAPSCFNEQPWRFVIGHREQTPKMLETLQGLLVEGNAWAKAAPVLMLSIASLKFEYNGKPNRHALHDVGLAVENMVLQAERLGLATHQMAGFHLDQSYKVLGLNPDDFEPVAMIAVGYPGQLSDLPVELQAKETGLRDRNPLEAMAFGSAFGAPFPGCYT